MIPLDVLDVLSSVPQIAPPCVTFGDRDHPLRPSKLVQLTKCNMSAYMSMGDGEDDGTVAAQTGNLVHSAAAAFHRLDPSVPLSSRQEAGLAALDQHSREKFPRGNAPEARRIFDLYTKDPENQNAVCPWVEQPVCLILSPSEFDPTGGPVYCAGTLDQVRRDPVTGRLTIHDIKTGSAKTAEESLAEYVIQQAAYTLAARQTLDPNIEPGGLIYTPGYDKVRGRRHLPLKLTVEDCRLLLVPVVTGVALIRRGIPGFTPSSGNCEYCPHRPYHNCLALYRGVHTR